MMIEEFLNNFYDCLHFSQNEAFPAERFASLFAEHAVLIEHQPHGFQTLSAAEFIASMNAYQAEMIGTFHERQTNFQVSEEAGVLIVDSDYEKQINDQHFTGTNHMILTEIQGQLKIISIVF
ncbi:hypothetical protein [Dielma fastidiosa]|nr:hypothetical protein [Dielma fastidiosa]